MSRQFQVAVITLCLLGCFYGCDTLNSAGRTMGNVGRAGWAAAKVTGKVVSKTGEVAYKTGKVTSKVVRTGIYMAKGKQVIPLEKRGNALFVRVKLNRNTSARLLIDTGASSMMISQSLAKRLRLTKGEPTKVSVANGQVVSGRKVIIREVKLNGVTVKNVEAVVLNRAVDKGDGLLGMSFLNHFVFQIDADRQELVLQQKAR